MKLTDIKIDSTKQDNADWVDDIPEFNGVRLKVRAAENKDWRRMRQTLFDALPRRSRVAGRIPPEDNDRIIAILLRDASLVDWEGFEDEHGQPVPYSKELAGKLLTDPDYVKFRDAVLHCANIVAEQSKNDAEETAKN